MSKQTFEDLLPTLMPTPEEVWALEEGYYYEKINYHMKHEQDITAWDLAEEYYGNYYHCTSVTAADDVQCVVDDEADHDKYDMVFDNHLSEADRTLHNILHMAGADESVMQRFWELIRDSMDKDVYERTMFDMHKKIKGYKNNQL